ncbi:MAG: ATP-binding protein [Deltaproteobacteria bacterium]|jgi:AAA+ superfamily predicted ATPase|nr:ATP-binding protein [Deltaproteobacteria bacterium]
MARSDLVKKLFINFKTNDRDGFIKAANEIIEDERKKNHATLAEELRRIINFDSISEPKRLSNPSTTFGHGSWTGFENGIETGTENARQALLHEIIYPEKTLSDAVLTDSNKQKIEEIIREFLNWDVLTSNGVYPIRRVLFYGPPGCGKTMTAGAIAAELGLPILYVRFDAIVSSYLGETASNIRKVFDSTKGDSYVMFFDEFDAIARSRNDQYEHGEIKRVVNTFLQQIDNFRERSLIIAATNFEQSLDYAIWRRFDSTVMFDMPDNGQKIKLFNLKLKQFKGSEKIISEFITDMENFSHADVEKAALSVIKRCILDGRRMYNKNDIELSVLKQKELVKLRKTQYCA